MNIPQARSALASLRMSMQQLFDQAPPPAGEQEELVAAWFGSLLDLVGVAEDALEPTDEEEVAGEQDASQARG